MSPIFFKIKAKRIRSLIFKDKTLNLDQEKRTNRNAKKYNQKHGNTWKYKENNKKI